MRKIHLLLLLLALLAKPTIAQNKQERFNRDYATAISLIKSNDFDGAVKILKRLYLQKPENTDILYNLGNSYLNTSDGPDSAIIYFEKALQHLPIENYNTLYGIDLHLALGKSYQLTNNPEKALAIYHKLETAVPIPNKDLTQELEREKAYCNNAKQLIQKPVRLEVQNLGTPLNSKYDDHSPLLSADETTLLFTSRRPSYYSELLDDGQYAERIFTSTFKNGKWQRPEAIRSLFKTQGHESGVNLSADGRYLFIYRTDINGTKLYMSEFDGETWSKAERMPEPISSRYDETHISLSPDGTIAYFTSNRPGGFGGLDIYRSRQLPDGSWATPQNLGANINTPEDEESPMLHPDGKTLYFSSRGHNSMGGFDIFTSKETDDSTWTQALNIGYPINSADDDLFFVPTAIQNRAYYASSRFKHKIGRIDLYEINYEEPEEARLAIIKGSILSDYPMDNLRISITDSNNKLSGLYKPNPVTGKYILILNCDETYTMNIEGAGYNPISMPVAVGANQAYRKKGEFMQLNSISMTKVEIAQTQPTEELHSLIQDGIPYYTVQILSLREPANQSKAWKGLDPSLVKEYRYRDGWYVYSYGRFKGFKAAVEAKKEIIRNTPYDDSFVRNPNQYDKFVDSEGANDSK